VLDEGRRALHGRAAPARGLTLERVVYGSISQTTQEKNEPRRRRRGAAGPDLDETGEQGT
jgi:tRNA U38,U39,U40 pseudouridine synthase TruA